MVGQERSPTYERKEIIIKQSNFFKLWKNKAIFLFAILVIGLAGLLPFPASAVPHAASASDQTVTLRYSAGPNGPATDWTISSFVNERRQPKR
jgi:hypothetical protein